MPLTFPTDIGSLPHEQAAELNTEDAHGGISPSAQYPILPWAIDRGTDDTPGVNSIESGWEPLLAKGISGVYWTQALDAPAVEMMIADPVFFE